MCKRLILLHGYDQNQKCHGLQVSDDMTLKDILNWKRKNNIKGTLFYRIIVAPEHTIEGSVLDIDNKTLKQLKEG